MPKFDTKKLACSEAPTGTAPKSSTTTGVDGGGKIEDELVA